MKKIFVSHASKDSAIIDDFVKYILVAGMKIDKSEIAYTSNEEMGVEPGESITDYIKNNIADSAVFISMISNNYNASPVCMQEIGHVRNSDKRNIQILLPGATFDMLPLGYQHIKAIEINKKDSLKSVCKTIQNILNIENVDIVKRDEYIDLFVENCKNKFKLKTEINANKKLSTKDTVCIPDIFSFEERLNDICSTYELATNALNKSAHRFTYNTHLNNILQSIEKHHPPTLLLFKDELLKFIENKQQQIHKKGISIGKVKGFIALLEHSMYHISCTRDVY